MKRGVGVSPPKAAEPLLVKPAKALMMLGICTHDHKGSEVFGAVENTQLIAH